MAARAPLTKAQPSPNTTCLCGMQEPIYRRNSASWQLLPTAARCTSQTCACVAPASWPLHGSSTPIPSGRATSQYVAPTVKPIDHVCRPCPRLCARASRTARATSQVRAFLAPVPHVTWDSVVGSPYRPRLSVMAESMPPRTPHFSATSHGTAPCPSSRPTVLPTCTCVPPARASHAACLGVLLRIPRTYV
ncbi:hypothetical protein TorRG33x02_271880 [Trema orientale]|uniref:Uncharacterized protein n=1 Tax=Trema orientale TaxID=63057 RepID=A0A2P5CVE8_TREOI|nr:hypothetical protein TorRG33x02_271880 [Trema orientale]